MDSGAYTVSSGFCDMVLGEKVASHRVLGESTLLHTTEAIPMAQTSKFILVGAIAGYPTLELTNLIGVNHPCTNYGYVAIHVVCQHSKCCILLM